MRFGAIITAGGSSTRFGSNKLIEKVNGKTVIEYSVEAFLKSDIDEIVICGDDYLKEVFCHSELYSESINNKIKFVKGGQTRQESVYNGLTAINCDYVLIHDAARPMITPEIIEKVKDEVVDKKAVSVMIKTVDTIKEVNGQLFICADHGNAEKMVDEATGKPLTSHTNNPILFIMVNYNPDYTLKEGGRLADVVPTLIDMMGKKKPKEMTGESLLIQKSSIT